MTEGPCAKTVELCLINDSVCCNGVLLFFVPWLSTDCLSIIRQMFASTQQKGFHWINLSFNALSKFSGGLESICCLSGIFDSMFEIWRMPSGCHVLILINWNCFIIPHERSRVRDFIFFPYMTRDTFESKPYSILNPAPYSANTVTSVNFISFIIYLLQRFP